MHSKGVRAKQLFHPMKQNARRSESRATPLEKGIQTIEYLRSRNGEWSGVREVAAALRISPATASRILRIFWGAGWITRSGEGRRVKYLISRISGRG